MGDCAERAYGEPIAIVGIGCRFPGGSSTPSKLWDLLKQGRSAHSRVPANRFDIDPWLHPDPSRPGSIPSAGGYFLSHDDAFQQFDPSFFGISPLEAASMDPQHMKFLEVVYESFESAGATLEQLSGSNTSCYVGCFTRDVAMSDMHEYEYGVPYQMTGSGLTILSNRVNYVFNLNGPSMTVDTACSSSLYALHMACMSLQAGEVDAAIVGGSNLILGVEQHIATVRLGVFSGTSTCHSFDESADGFGRGDGICAFYLKTLSKAVADSDPIRAVIRATALNTNGRSQGINHPSVEGQETVIRAAYARTGLDFRDTSFFECHGTGTQVGDPIEVAAVANVFAPTRTPENPLLLSSIKTNIGHTEGTSGLASVLKAILSIENDLIPATVGVKTLNPAIDFKGGRLEVVRSTRPWPSMSIRRASINSFGYGGANAHCIIESPDILLGPINGRHRLRRDAGWLEENEDETTRSLRLSFHKRKYLWVFSAHDRTTLERNVQALAAVANSHDVADIAHTLATRRSKHRISAFAIVSGPDFASDLAPQHIQQVSQPAFSRPHVAFAFTGQGAQWPQMGHSLAQRYPVVHDTLQVMQKALDNLPTPPTWMILKELSRSASDSRVQEAELSQPLCIAVQVAIVALLKSWGIKPAAVVGHSSGEVPAAFAAGLLTAEEAILVAYYRGIAHVVCHEDGAMLAVGLGATEVQRYIEDQPDVTIACENSPQSVSLSGGEDAIEVVRIAVTKDGIFARKINTYHNAYHSPRVKRAGQYYVNQFSDSLSSIKRIPRNCSAPMYSCITGQVLRDGEDVGIEYWRKNMVERVRFTDAVSNLMRNEAEVNTMIEIGPHKALAGILRDISAALGFTAENLDYVPTLIRNSDGVEDLLRTAGKLYSCGYPVDLARVNAETDQKVRFVHDLPTYQWNYGEMHRTSNRQSRHIRYRKHPRHDLLGSRQLLNSDFSPEWRNRLRIKDVPWIADHQIGSDVLFPAAGYAAMAIEAVTQISETKGTTPEGYSFQRLHIKSPMVIPFDGDVEILFNLHPKGTYSTGTKQWFDFSVSTVSALDKWVEHAVGCIAAENLKKTQLATAPEVKGHSGAVDIKSSDGRWYSAMSDIGLHYGPSFRPLRDIRTDIDTRTAMAYISLEPTSGMMIQESRYMVHPATLDGCLQLVSIASQGDVKEAAKSYLPTVIDSLRIWRTPQSLSSPKPKEGIVTSHGTRKGMRSMSGTTELYARGGEMLAQVSVSFYSLEGFGSSKGTQRRQPYSRLIWTPDIDTLNEDDFRRLYPPSGTVDGTSKSDGETPCSTSSSHIANILNLIAQKEPEIQIMYIVLDTESSMRMVQKALSATSSTRSSVQLAMVAGTQESLEPIKTQYDGTRGIELMTLDMNQDILEQGFAAECYDILVVSDIPYSDKANVEALRRYQVLLKPNGRLVLHTSDAGTRASLDSQLMQAGFSQASLVLDCQGDEHSDNNNKIIISHRATRLESPLKNTATLWIICGRGIPTMVRELESQLRGHGLNAKVIGLTTVGRQLPAGARALMLAELDAPLLSSMNGEEMDAVKVLLDTASSIIWVTNAGIRAGKRPQSSLISGLAGSITASRPSLRISIIDVDLDEADITVQSRLIVKSELALRDNSGIVLDSHIAISNGVQYVPRYVVDDVENQAFEAQFKRVIEQRKLPSAMELSFQQVGQVDTFYFQDKGPSISVEGDVHLTPSSYCLSKREAAILKGVQDAETFSSICIATVTSSTDRSKQLEPGQSVICFRAGNFDSSFSTSSKNCEGLRLDDNAENMMSSMLPFCSAMHALSDLARVQKGQTVLVHRVAGPGEVAAARYARLLGAVVITSFESDEKRNLFQTAYPDLTGCIPILADSELAVQVSSSTSGHMIDVAVVLSEAPDLPEVWSLLARKGSLVYGADAELPNMSLLDPSVLARGASLMTFKIQDMLNNEVDEMGKLVRKVILLLRDDFLPPIVSMATFDIAQLSDAVATVSQPNSTSNIILQYQPDSVVPIHVAHQPIRFPPTATYLLVGCLGGLGRSLVMWMVARGARHFLFLSRSGADKPEAAALVKELEEIAVGKKEELSVTVVRGDVAERADVDRAVAESKTPIRGVMQHAAVFREGLFEDLTLEDWQAVLRPKVQGTINLHEALKHTDLDFFVMTSSTIGVTGAATQSSYAAANAFLDSMARHRHSLGLPACALALGMVIEVGHVQENPDVLETLRRNGIHGITEDDYLRMIELACRSPQHSHISWKHDDAAQCHMVTGLEPGKVSPKSHFLNDARFVHIAAAVSAAQQTPNLSTSSSGGSKEGEIGAILHAAYEQGGEDAVKAAILDVLLEKMAKIVLSQVDRLREGVGRSLADFGLNDSMFTAELKGWAWKELKVDLPFMLVLEGSVTIAGLRDVIWEKMGEGGWNWGQD